MLAAFLLDSPPPIASSRPAERAVAPERTESEEEVGERIDRPEPAPFQEVLAALLSLASPTPTSALTTGAATQPSARSPLVPSAAPSGRDPAVVKTPPIDKGAPADPTAAQPAPETAPAPTLTPASAVIAPPAGPAGAPAAPLLVQMLQGAKNVSPSLTGRLVSSSAGGGADAGSAVPTPGSPATPLAAVSAAGDLGGFGHNGDSGGSALESPMSPSAAAPETGSADPAATPFEPAAGPSTAASNPSPLAAPHVRAGSETVAALAAELARKLDARVTKFDLRLDPAGLGGVQVALEIRSGGEVSAHLSFERPETMTDLKARMGELRDALEQAGFQLDPGALSFDSHGRRQSSPDHLSEAPGRPAFTPAEPEPSAAPSVARRGRSALDVRI